MLNGDDKFARPAPAHFFLHFLFLFCTTKTWNFHVTHYFYWGIVVCAHPKFCRCLCSCSLLFFHCRHCWLSYFTLASLWCGQTRGGRADARSPVYQTVNQMVLGYEMYYYKKRRVYLIRRYLDLSHSWPSAAKCNTTPSISFFNFKKWFEPSSWRAATYWEISQVL